MTHAWLAPRRLRAFALCAALTFAAAGCGGAPDTAEGVTPIKVGTFPGALQNFPVYLADELNYFEDERIDVSFVNFTTAPDLATAVITGAADIGDQGLAVLWPLLKRGEQITALQGGLRLNYGLAARPDVKLQHEGAAFPENLQDLKGKRIGVTSRGSLTEQFAVNLADAAGLDPDKDLTFVATGGGPTAVAAFENDQVDMLVLYPPLAQSLGEPGKDFTVVADMLDGGKTTADVMRGQLIDVQAANPKWLADNPTAARGFCSALDRARAYLADPSHESEAAEKLAAWSNIDASVAKDVLDIYGETFSPRLTEELWTAQAEFGAAGSKGFVPEYDEYVYGPCQ